MFQICSDRGECVCGSCQCHPISNWDARSAGKHCGLGECSSPACHQRQCRALVDCVLCYYHKGNGTSLCDEECDVNVIPDYLLKKTDESNNLSDSWRSCADIRTNIGCYTKFFYKHEFNYIKILIQMKSDCIESYYG